MHCASCGTQMPRDARFCPRCGAEARDAPSEVRGESHDSAERTRGLPDAAVIVCLVLLGPIGLILMWTSARWSRRTKIAITGFLFPPVWALLIWDLPIDRWIRMGLIAALLALNTAWIGFLAGPTPAFITLFVTLFLGVVWMASRMRGVEPDRTETSSLRRVIESKLDTCHDIIAEVEGTAVLDLLPDDSPSRRRYRHALEMRSEGMDLLERARSEPDLVAADSRISRALDELRDARDAIAHALP